MISVKALESACSGLHNLRLKQRETMEKDCFFARDMLGYIVFVGLFGKTFKSNVSRVFS